MRCSQEELDLIQSAMNTEKKARVFKRYQALYLFLTGKTRNEVADIVGISPNTVSNIHRSYRHQGLNGLYDKPVPGRPTRLTEEQQANLRSTIINNTPSELGFPADYNWTAGLIAKLIEREYGYKYSIRGVTGMLKRMKLSYTRPTYVLAMADAQKQEQFIEDFRNVKKNCWTETFNKSSL